MFTLHCSKQIILMFCDKLLYLFASLNIFHIFNASKRQMRGKRLLGKQKRKKRVDLIAQLLERNAFAANPHNTRSLFCRKATNSTNRKRKSRQRNTRKRFLHFRKCIVRNISQELQRYMD